MIPPTEPTICTGYDGTPWALRAADESAVRLLTQRLQLPDVIARLLVARGIAAEDAAAFLQPTLRAHMPNPNDLPDMESAAARLAQAIKTRETVGVFGDYDVDGATSSALLHDVLSALNVPVEVHIPDRMKEGYGPNAPALLALQARGANLVLTVDCGTVAYAPLAEAAEAGMEVMVIDHHQGEPELPRAYAVVNPNRADADANPFQHMAAVGVVFLLLATTLGVLRREGWFASSGVAEPNLLHRLDVVALGTVCDVMPLTGINRALVAQGLKQLASRHRLGLRVLADRAGVAETPTAYHLGFVFGPRINAGGRVGQADLGTRLLTTQSTAEAEQISVQLEHFNAERKALEAQALDEAIAQAEAKRAANPALPVLLLHAEGWHAGVIGIVAGRVKERFQLPTMIVAMEGGIGKASCRSITGVDLGLAVAAAKAEGLLIGGGGHAMAAGFTVAMEKLAALEAFFCARMADAVARASESRRLWLDGQLHLNGVSVELAEAVQQLGPFGNGNPAPRWWLPQVRVVQIDAVGEEHLRLWLADAGSTSRSTARVRAMAFRARNTPWGQQLVAARMPLVHIAGTLQLNHWQGKTRADFIVDAVAPA